MIMNCGPIDRIAYANVSESETVATASITRIVLRVVLFKTEPRDSG